MLRYLLVGVAQRQLIDFGGDEPWPDARRGPHRRASRHPSIVRDLHIRAGAARRQAAPRESLGQLDVFLLDQHRARRMRRQFQIGARLRLCVRSLRKRRTAAGRIVLGVRNAAMVDGQKARILDVAARIPFDVGPLMAVADGGQRHGRAAFVQADLLADAARGARIPDAVDQRCFRAALRYLGLVDHLLQDLGRFAHDKIVVAARKVDGRVAVGRQRGLVVFVVLCGGGRRAAGGGGCGARIIGHR